MKLARTLAYSYLRFSHPDQAKGDSKRRQNALRDAWLKNHPEVQLDTSITLEDKGVSGFTGHHRDNPDRHALAAFLALVRQGRIRRGSYLVVESLDRLSREHIRPALTLLLNLIEAGVKIVQLLPAEAVYDEGVEAMKLMMAIMELSRGHSESQMKSERVGSAWQDKKKRAAKNKEVLTARGPAWLRLVEGKWKVSDRAADAIRRIYGMAIAGYGLGVITKKLNAEKAPTIGSKARHWARSYVAKLLSNPAVIGTYQPFKGRGVKREPDGKPITGYYPAVVTEDEWYAARAALTSRRGKAGRLSKERINVFSGLLFDARDGGSIQQTNKGKKSSWCRLLVSYKAVQGVEGSKYTSFPAETFERGVLSMLREIDPREIMPDDQGEDKAQVITGRLAEVETEIEKLKSRLESKGYSDALADVLDRHETRRKKLAAELTDAHQAAASPLGMAWKDCRSLVDVLDAAPDQEETRVRLRAALRRIVESVQCLFIGRGSTRIAVAQVRFAGGRHRDYVILRKAATGGSVGDRPAEVRARSLAFPGKRGEFDLRTPGDVRALEAALTAVDVEKLAA
jgi:DNA invertase Pin-like site-specific DNA recombinase